MISDPQIKVPLTVLLRPEEIRLRVWRPLFVIIGLLQGYYKLIDTYILSLKKNAV